MCGLHVGERASVGGRMVGEDSGQRRRELACSKRARQSRQLPRWGLVSTIRACRVRRKSNSSFAVGFLVGLAPSLSFSRRVPVAGSPQLQLGSPGYGRVHQRSKRMPWTQLRVGRLGVGKA